jgi:hypothetical protein
MMVAAVRIDFILAEQVYMEADGQARFGGSDE